MAFLNELSKDAAKVTGDMAEVIKLNATVAAREQKIENCYREIGKIYYENFADRNEELFRSQVESIRASESLILSEAKKLITKIKGLIVCPSCGSGQPLDSIFCSVCGTRLAESANVQPVPSVTPVVEEPAVETIPVVEEPVAEISVAEEPAQDAGNTVCKVCGTPMSEDMLFCINCGTRRS